MAVFWKLYGRPTQYEYIGYVGPKNYFSSKFWFKNPPVRRLFMLGKIKNNQNFQIQDIFLIFFSKRSLFKSKIGM